MKIPHNDGNVNVATFKLKVLQSQITESVTSLLHTILLLRSTGKYQYRNETTYRIKPCGVADVSCDFVNLSYARADSDQLDQLVKQKAEQFSETLRASKTSHTGTIILSFYQKNQMAWALSLSSIPWETWTVEVQVIELRNEMEKQCHRVQLGLEIDQMIMNAVECVQFELDEPGEPLSVAETDIIFDTSFPDVQPYRFKIDHTVQAPSTISSVTSYFWNSLF